MKKWLKSLLCVGVIMGCFTFALTGCGAQPPFKNTSNEILFNGGIVSRVGDNILFANGYSSSEITTIDEFNTAAEYSYLASLDLSKPESSSDKFTSPAGVKKLNSEVVGYSNMYSFVFGDQVYYASPNKHKTSENKYVFSYVSFFKTDFAGNKIKELFTTKSYDVAKAVVRALKTGDKAVIVVYDGTELNLIDLSNDKVKTVSAKATSVAVPRENENWNGKIYYTENKDNPYGTTGNEAFVYDLATGQSEALGNSVNRTITFTGRVGDNVFYTYKEENTSISKTLLAQAADLEAQEFSTAGKDFYTSEISQVFGVGGNMNGHTGFIFSSSLTGSSQILYVNMATNAAPEVLLTSSEFSKLLFTHNDLVYYSTTNGISFKSVANISQSVPVVENMTIVSDKIGYDFYESGNLQNIYFYAQRVYSEDSEVKEEDRETNSYLYMVSASGNETPRLVGKTIK